MAVPDGRLREDLSAHVLWSRILREQVYHELVNNLSVLQRFVELFAGRHGFVGAAGVAKGGGIGG